jgi:hypothetical protein
MNSLAYLSRQFDVVASSVAATASAESLKDDDVDDPSSVSGATPQKRPRRGRSRRIRNSNHMAVATRRRSLLELSPFAWPVLFAWGWSNRWPRSDKLVDKSAVAVTDTENSEDEGIDDIRLDGLRLSPDYSSNVPPTLDDDTLPSSSYFNRPQTNITLDTRNPNPSVNLTPPTPNMNARQLPPPQPTESPTSQSEQLLPNPLRLSLLTTTPPSRKSTPTTSAAYPESRTHTPRPAPAPTPFHLPKTLILDLDETLIHSTSRSPHVLHTGSSGLLPFSLSVPFLGLGNSRARGRAHMIEVVLGGRSTLYHVYKRPFVDYFLRKVRRTVPVDLKHLDLHAFRKGVFVVHTCYIHRFNARVC